MSNYVIVTFVSLLRSFTVLVLVLLTLVRRRSGMLDRLATMYVPLPSMSLRSHRSLITGRQQCGDIVTRLSPLTVCRARKRLR